VGTWRRFPNEPDAPRRHRPATTRTGSVRRIPLQRRGRARFRFRCLTGTFTRACSRSVGDADQGHVRPGEARNSWRAGVESRVVESAVEKVLSAYRPALGVDSWGPGSTRFGAGPGPGTGAGFSAYYTVNAHRMPACGNSICPLTPPGPGQAVEFTSSLPWTAGDLRRPRRARGVAVGRGRIRLLSEPVPHRRVRRADRSLSFSALHVDRLADFCATKTGVTFRPSSLPRSWANGLPARSWHRPAAAL